MTTRATKPPGSFATAHPLVRELVARAAESGMTLLDITTRARLSAGTVSAWRNRGATVRNLDKALGTLGLKLAIVPRDGT